MSNQPVFLYTNALGTNEFPASLSTITTVSKDNVSPFVCSGIGIARAKRNGSVQAQYSSNGSDWTTAATLFFSADKAAMTTFTAVSARYWRAVFDAETQVGVIKIGAALEMDQRNYIGVQPVPYAQEDSRRPNNLSMGQWLGRQAHARRASATYTCGHTTMAWIKQNAGTLIEALRDGTGVFYAWRPETYPQDVIYGFLSSPINPTLAGTLSHMDMTIELSGIYDTAKPVYTGPTVIAPGGS